MKIELFKLHDLDRYNQVIAIENVLYATTLVDDKFVVMDFHTKEVIKDEILQQQALEEVHGIYGV